MEALLLLLLLLLLLIDQEKLKQKNELPLGSREREDLVDEIKNQVSSDS